MLRAKKPNHVKKGVPSRQGTHVYEFPLVEKFPSGYRNREDITTLPPGIMVPGSQNVLTNVYQRVGIRRGYTLDGQRDTSRNPIMSSYDWNRHTGDTAHLRAGYDYANGNGKLQFRYVAAADGQSWNGNTFTKGQVYWIDLLTKLQSSSFNFCDFWDSSQVIDVLLFVNGQAGINEWSGAVTTLKSTNFSTGVIETYKPPGVINTVSIASGGSNYKVGDLLTLSNDGNGQAVVQVAGTNIAGVITSITLISGGIGYKTGSSFTTGGSGNGAQISVSTVYTAAGSGYSVGDTITVATGGGNATFKVLSITSAGGITGVTMTNPGTGYAAGVKSTSTAGGGTGAQIQVLTVAKGYLETQSDLSWGELGFYSSTNRIVNINGNQYTYTGGESTRFLTGITPDPSAEIAGNVVFQQPVYTPNTAIKDLPDDVGNSLIANLKNQIYVASGNDRSVYVSKTDNYKDFEFTSPTRLVGEGAVLTLDGIPTAFEPQQEQMYISAAKDQWYMTQFKLSSDNTAESLTVQRLKTTSHQGAQTQALTTKIKNYIAYVSFEPIINTLGIEPNFLAEPRVTDISFPIVNDMQVYDFTNGSVYYFPGSINVPGTYLIIAIPTVSKVLIYNMTETSNPYWEAPQIIPVTRFSIIDGDLYGHSSQSSNTYKLFTGTNDDGYAVNAVASFSFNNNGVRTVRKSATATYVEGYIAANTNLTLNLQRDMDGAASSYSTIIAGTDTQIVPPYPDTASFGKQSLGKDGLGAEFNFASPQAKPPKFRVEKTYTRVEYFEEQVSFQSIGTDQVWEIIAFGSNATPVTQEPTDIRE